MTRSGKPTDPHRTVRDPAHTLPEIQALRDKSSRPPAQNERKAVLVVLAGPQLGERTLVDRSVTIGRGPENELVLRDPAVSWKHAIVEALDGGRGIRVRDQRGVLTIERQRRS